MRESQPNPVLETRANQSCDLSVLYVTSEMKDLGSANEDALDAKLQVNAGDGLDLVEVEQVKEKPELVLGLSICENDKSREHLERIDEAVVVSVPNRKHLLI